jgi:threonylcarbamoyladenosine tRNA methylthiotransferase CDKAL1
MPKIYLETYGCQANIDDSNIMKAVIEKEGFTLTDNILESDIAIVNTCVVKERTTNKINHRLRQLSGMKRLIIAGCMPESETEFCRKHYPDASIVNTFHVTDIVEAIKSHLNGRPLFLLGKRKENKLGITLPANNIATIQIASGCASQCYFCETKLAKGSIKSAPEDTILNEVRRCKNSGAQEIHLTSTDCGAYGLDIGIDLPHLLGRIIMMEGDFKLRIGMMNPEHVIKYMHQLIEIYQSDKIMKFVHIPVQSLSNNVLASMNRRYTVAQFNYIVDNFRRNLPKMHIATDIIVGYPTESVEDFDATVAGIIELRPDVLNISRFSVRKGTVSAKLKKISSSELKRRSIILTGVYRNIIQNHTKL